MRARRLAVLGTCAALAVTGCGGGSSSNSEGGSTGGGKGGTTVSMKDIQFKPMDITVKRGTTVRWTNDDSVTHNVTKEKGPGKLESPNINPGQSFRATLTTPGKISYVCTIHPNQRGTITVK